MTKEQEKKVEQVENPNLSIYNKVREVPQTALKQIKGGRLNGMSDINPMWRIKVMTETFGICGIGWKYEVTKQWTEPFGTEIRGFCNINLYVKVDGQWSEPIFGTGGSSFVTSERNGSYVNDEVYKMALTDALSVAMKALGVGADVYFGSDKPNAGNAQANKTQQDFRTKYAMDEQKANGTLPMKERDEALEMVIFDIGNATNKDDLMRIYKECTAYHNNTRFMGALTKRKNELGIKK